MLGVRKESYFDIPSVAQNFFKLNATLCAVSSCSLTNETAMVNVTLNLFDVLQLTDCMKRFVWNE